ncbi:MAG: hypothetical protein R2825_27965 [Saprospiraceae bacterium]
MCKFISQNPASVVFVGGNEVTVSERLIASSNQIWTVGNMPAGATETITVNWFILEKAALTGWAEVACFTPSDDDNSTPATAPLLLVGTAKPPSWPLSRGLYWDQSINFPTIPDKRIR